MNNNQKKIRELPIGNQIFLYSYFALLILTLLGFIASAMKNNSLTLICMILVIITLVINIVAAFR